MSWRFVVRGVSVSLVFLLTVAIRAHLSQPPPQEQADAALTTHGAMRAMYGNFNSWDNTSRMRLSPAKEGLRYKFHGELTAWALLDASYVEAGTARHLLVTLAQPVGTPWDCHACSLLVGAAIFSRSNSGWSLTARRFALAEVGEFSEQPRATLQPLGPNHFGFRLESDSSGGGTGVEFSVFDISGTEIKEVLFAPKDSSFMSDRCWPMSISHAWVACVEFTGGFSLAPAADPEHYDIVLTRRVTDSVTRRIPRGTYLFRYQYSGGQYILKESSPKTI